MDSENANKSGQEQQQQQKSQEQSEPQTTKNEPVKKDEASTDNISNTITKISLLLMPAPGTPILKKKNFKVDPAFTIGQLSQLIRNFLKIDNSESLFIYVNQIFAPSLEQTCKNLYECFGCDGKLILYYAKSQAWG